MNGKVVVITGGTSGIGQVAAEKLAGMGARIVLVARDKSRADSTLARLRQIAPALNHTVHFADVSRIGDVRRVAREIAAAEPRIDVLLNNAGAMFYDRQVTVDGLERTFATNHMSYFVLTLSLRPQLAAAAPSRVVNTCFGCAPWREARLRRFAVREEIQGIHGVWTFQAEQYPIHAGAGAAVCGNRHHGE